MNTTRTRIATEPMTTTTDAVTNAAANTRAAFAPSYREAEAAKVQVEAVAADAHKLMNENIDKFSKGFGGFTAFSQDNMDALVKSSELAAKAAEGIGSEVSAYSKKAFEDAVSAVQEIASAKTMTELFEKQTAFAQSAFEGFVHQSTKMNEILVAATKDVTGPIGARVTAATEKMKSFAL